MTNARPALIAGHTSAVSGIIGLQRWGRTADRSGNLRRTRLVRFGAAWAFLPGMTEEPAPRES